MWAEQSVWSVEAMYTCKQCKQCTQCKQCKQCKKFIALCYLHPWWYFQDALINIFQSLRSSYTATLCYGLWKIIHSACMFVYSYNMNVNGFKWCGMDSNGMFMRCPNGHRLLAIYPTSAQDTNCPIQHWQREWFKKPNMKKVAGILELETSYIEISSKNFGSR